jgi:hypothetical protein
MALFPAGPGAAAAEARFDRDGDLGRGPNDVAADGLPR